MKINKIQFIKGYVNTNKLPNSLPEIAIMGRSNVGKSSLLNYLFNRKNIVKTSQTPGKTKELNYFLVNEKIHFVDIPGFGYAKISKIEKDKLSLMIKNYIDKSKKIKGILYLIDTRIIHSKIDSEALNWLNHKNINILVLLTKIDKLKKQELNKNIKLIQENYNLQHEPYLTSTTKKIGKKNILKEIEFILNN